MFYLIFKTLAFMCYMAIWYSNHVLLFLCIKSCLYFSLFIDYSRVPLGMSNGFIKNDQITATSKFDPTYFAYTARLKLTGIRWCSVLKSSGVDYSEYVQVDFKSVVTLTGVATQGDDNYASNYVKKYFLEVSIDGSTYSDLKGNDGNRQVFTLYRIFLL